MLKDAEDAIVKILQEKIVEVPRDNIGVNIKRDKLPAINLSALKLKFTNASLSENIEKGKVELEEKIDSNSVKTSYKLKEKPSRGSLHVESPQGPLSEKEDYSVNYSEGAINFKKTPEKMKGSILVRYQSHNSIVTMKSLKIKALYTIDVRSPNRVEADSIAEKVVKTLLALEDQLLTEGIDLKPIEGIVSSDEDGKNTKVQLNYTIEREIQVEQVAEPIEKIEITRKNI